jgi:hypothetical protein
VDEGCSSAASIAHATAPNPQLLPTGTSVVGHTDARLSRDVTNRPPIDLLRTGVPISPISCGAYWVPRTSCAFP